jgi:hypothetical protein
MALRSDHSRLQATHDAQQSEHAEALHGVRKELQLAVPPEGLACGLGLRLG